jgi:hypothetical protein
MAELSAAQLIDDPIGQEGWLPISAIVLMVGLHANEAEIAMWNRRDTETPIWTHIGMLEAALIDLKAQWQTKGDDDG